MQGQKPNAITLSFKELVFRARCSPEVWRHNLSMAAEPESFIPRVQASALQVHAHASEEWQVASEKLTLSLCRHNVCVLQTSIPSSVSTEAGFSSMHGLLWSSPEDLPQASVPSAEDETGLLRQPGRHSYSFKLGSTKAENLTSIQTGMLEQVQLSLLA